ncbi:MAG: T9SS type A sorting domain-containing protein [Ferruginibacter sp.]
MKKGLLLLFLFAQLHTRATTWNVNISNFQFTPASLNVVVGDVIHWVWVGGFHSTTSSVVPATALAWDSSPTGTVGNTFDYTVTAAGTYTYFCTVHGAAVMSGSFTASVVLPVVLSGFDVSYKNNSPFLSWVTQSESNADYFSIRKSTNGTTFSEVARVPANGNSSVEKTYSFTDKKIPGGIKYVYYALSIVDKDGRSQLSPIKLLKNNIAADKLIISLSPNPLNSEGVLMLKFNGDKAGSMSVVVTDVQGRQVIVTTLSAVSGINNGHIHLGGLPAGSYFVRFKLDEVIETYKVNKK